MIKVKWYQEIIGESLKLKSWKKMIKKRDGSLYKLMLTTGLMDVQEDAMQLLKTCLKLVEKELIWRLYNMKCFYNSQT